jgi:cysteine desulfurase
MSSVYLDHAATTPLDPRVLEAMLPLLREPRGNPSSIHAVGESARTAVEEARAEVARFLGARPQEIIFTGSGTEADNLAVLGLAGASEGRHVVASPVEHPAVRNAVRHLEARGYEVTWLAVDGFGLVDPAELRAALRPDTAFATVMWANNEVGTVQPVAELAAVCAEAGIPFHTDAVQAVGHLPVSVEEAAVSTLAFSGHKLYGPQGVGVLYVREGVRLEPGLSFGGGQERGLRSGTENVVGICGLGAACRLAREELEVRMSHERALRERVVSGLAAIPGVQLNGHPERRLPNNAHVSVSGVEAESLVLILDARGFAVGKGSACSSSEHKASPVLVAMGLGEPEAFSAVRVSVGAGNTAEQVDRFVEAFSGAVEQLRELSPVYAAPADQSA